jgi:serine/threonine-protein kinase
MNRVVALKVLAPQVVESERAHELFLREVQAAAQLHHPNIVLAYDANELEGRHFLAMEFVDGPNLERYVKKNGPLPIELACEVIFQAATGLQYAHEKGMVHRDIKPANLLLQQDANSRTVQVKILDFGLARFTQPDWSHASETILSKQNTVMGTPDFLSPEQSKDLHETDIRSDLYSLGCTFHYLLTGQVPFPGGSIVDKLIRHNKEEAVPVDELRPGVPKTVADIVRKLMAKKPTDRFQTPDDLLNVLAPHAAPSMMDWTTTTPSLSSLGRISSENIELPEEVQVDTEPRAQTSTQISDAESILDWVDVNRKQRRRVRRFVLAAVLALGLLGLTVAGVLAWIWLGTAP